MKFYNYLNEDTALENFIHNVKKDCKPYLDLLKKNKMGFFYRGLNQNLKFGIKNVRQDRQPKGTNKETFKWINNILQKNKHTRRDQSISITSDKKWAEFFGYEMFVFPVGKFDYSWINMKDFNDISNFTHGAAPKEFTNAIRGYVSELPDYELKVAEKFLLDMITTNKGIEEAYMKGYEVWVNPKKYYILNTQYEMHAVKHLLMDHME